MAAVPLHGVFAFQHTAARRRLGPYRPIRGWQIQFQHTAARRRLGKMRFVPGELSRFNTQPPEGGWSLSQKPCSIRFRSPDFAKLTRKARTRV